MEQTQQTPPMIFNPNWFVSLDNNLTSLISEVKALRAENADIKTFIKGFENQLLTEKEVEQKLNLKRTSVYFLVKKGVLNPVRNGKSLRFSKLEIENYINQSQNV
ncbi:MAG: helix-turn-helix domain-containing protein [Bacteroidales bacterium]|nr:helix-turn-helix domain-containing protein [Bacteroidales bacterium]